MALFLKKIYRGIINLMPDRWAIRVHYLRNFGLFPSLSSPVSFNEKINWRKLNQRNPLFTRFSDKITAKDEVAHLLGTEVVNPTLWTGTDISKIPWDDFPGPFVIKWNHSAGGVIFVRDPALINRSDAHKKLNSERDNRHGHFSREWGYYDISPKLLIEPMLLTEGNHPPDDYKLFVYHGRVHFVQVESDRFTQHKRCFYDRDWNRVDITLSFPVPLSSPARPECLDRMIEVAEKIGGLFDFVRVDCYQLPPLVFFGEATFYPGGGYEPFKEYDMDLFVGAPWKLHHNSL